MRRRFERGNSRPVFARLSLATINKGLLCVALAALLFRRGSFSSSFIPNPFEMIFALVLLLAFIDIVKNKKIKEFWRAAPKNIWIALGCLVFSIVSGWIIAMLFKGIPTSFNMIMEFGVFAISLGLFLLILFYTKNDHSRAEKYLFMLVLPAVYIPLVLFHGTADSLHLTQSQGGNFLGLTTNPNVISKILLIPAMFFIAKSLFEAKTKWLPAAYILISSSIVALVLWTASRGALLSLVLGALFVGLVFSLHDFNWKKLFSSGIIVFMIFLLGFGMTPYARKQIVLNRILHKDTDQIKVSELKNKSLSTIIQESLHISFNVVQEPTPATTINVQQPVISTTTNVQQLTPPTPVSIQQPTPPAVANVQQSTPSTTNEPLPDTRITIWKFYLKQVLINPLGFGPNTHLKYGLVGKDGEYLSTGPHNSYLQIWFWGGLLGLLSFLYMLFSAFKSLKIKLQSNFSFVTVSAMSALFALSIAIMFDDALQFYWLWALLALSLRE